MPADYIATLSTRRFFARPVAAGAAMPTPTERAAAGMPESQVSVSVTAPACRVENFRVQPQAPRLSV